MPLPRLPLHRLLRPLLIAGLLAASFSASERSSGKRARLRCERCARDWVSSIYLADGPHDCPLCHAPLVASDPDAELDDVLASLWDVRLHAHDRVRRQPPRRAEAGLVLEALELLLDALAGPPGIDATADAIEPELKARTAWADFVLRRAFASLDESAPPPYEGRGPEETLQSGARTWTALEQTDNGREAALAIAGLSSDDLRAALLAALHQRVRETHSSEDAARWAEALSKFTEWWRPQDLL